MSGAKQHLSLFTVTWDAGASIVRLKSYDELKNAIDSGVISAKETGIVVNMPFLTWPDGRR